ncbi:MAG TPA: prolyl oligopeptidase family serine peptidase, partial [Pirellulaceae bacterium]|nr:prolyl oligopeptidase family serine peptidase [Pirellulaceae bacterium]
MSYPNQPGQSPFYPNPAPNPFYPPPPQQKPGGSKGVWIVLGVLGGGLLLGVLACCGFVGYLAQPAKASAAAKEPFSYADVPLPAFPDRSQPDNSEPGVVWHEIYLGDDGGYYDPPGHGGYMYLYLPDGQHQPQSLPCILHTGAGTTLLHGVELEGEGNPPEYIPYVKSGYAVLLYDMDGPIYDDEDVEEMRDAYKAFKASRAGLVNARNAIEYLIAKVPEVNPSQIYASGHSSAATHALLLAEHEPRLAGVIAYAPAVDLPKWFAPRLGVLRLLLPGVTDFVTQSSPNTHIARLKCPTLLFQAEDDSICDIRDTRTFADQLRAQGTDVTFISVPTGDHYEAMVNDGLP